MSISIDNHACTLGAVSVQVTHALDEPLQFERGFHALPVVSHLEGPLLNVLPCLLLLLQLLLRAREVAEKQVAGALCFIPAHAR